MSDNRSEDDFLSETVVVEAAVVVVDDEDEDDEAEDDDDGVPIDRGWAWMTVLALFFNLFILVGYVKALGVLFVEFLEIYQASVTMTTLLMGTMSATYSVASFFTMQVVLVHLDARKTIILGGILTSSGITLSYFADSVVFLICMQGIVLGIGHALVNGPGMILISEYFNKRRGIATAIAICGISVGGSVFPPFVNYLLEEFTLRDTFLILGAINLNIIVGGMLSRPVSFYKKSHARKRLLLGDKPAKSSHTRTKLLMEDTMGESSQAMKKRLLGDKTDECFTGVSKTDRKHSKAVNVIENHSNNNSRLVAKSRDHLTIDKSLQTVPCRKRTSSDSGTDTSKSCQYLLLSSASELGRVSVIDLTSLEHGSSRSLDTALTMNTGHGSSTNPGVGLINRQNDDCTNPVIGLIDRGHAGCTNPGTGLMNREHDDSTNPDISLINGHHVGYVDEKAKHFTTETHTDLSLCQRILQLMMKPFTSLDFSVFRSPLFSVFACAAFFTVQTKSNLTYVPALAIEHGISQSNAALLLTIIGSLDLLSKLAFGWFADLGVIRKHHLQMIGLCISATSSLFVSQYSSFPLMVGYAVIQGIFSGVYRSLYALVLIDFVGKENMGKAYGIIQLIHGSMVAIAHPVIGKMTFLKRFSLGS
ncbi:monocarboxylate transporter 12-like [Gigantopelta aegis]|uniref:monocarboxylate transporter 12-like n=1 Tax=Gigantopelta aegis TaxID=1735272 RepID=UPI001B88B54F|nr:monocarboxylate transporter 12-like [Gigantopelta aegis]